MKQLLLASMALAYASVSFAQQPIAGAYAPASGLPFPGAIGGSELVGKGDYLSPYLQLRSREEAYLADPVFRRTYFDFVGLYASFIGRYEEAIAFADSNAARPRPSGTLLSSEFEPVNAIDAVLDEAGSHRFVLVNEAHHVPMHRAFTLRLLRGLYERGYRYFAVEAVNEPGGVLSSRGHPTRESGLYTSEPVFGDLLRTALRLGFEVVSYDAPAPCGAGEAIRCASLRDSTAAASLLRQTIGRDPGARVLVHAGYGHVSEEPRQVEGQGELVWLGAWIRRMAALDPLTVDQTAMSERSASAYEHPAYGAAAARIEEPTVFRSDTLVWVDGEGPFQVDMQVFHPRTRYERDRPLWLLMDGQRRATPVTVRAGQGEADSASLYLVQAFKVDEGDRAIPVDQVAANAPGEVMLLLPRGSYYVQTLAAGGMVVDGFDMNVE